MIHRENQTPSGVARILVWATPSGKVCNALLTCRVSEEWWAADDLEVYNFKNGQTSETISLNYKKSDDSSLKIPFLSGVPENFQHSLKFVQKVLGIQMLINIWSLLIRDAISEKLFQISQKIIEKTKATKNIWSKVTNKKKYLWDTWRNLQISDCFY